MAEERVCDACGRLIKADDRYCPSCGIAFGGAPARVERGSLPGFSYHFVQGLAWGLGLTVAAVIVSAIAYVLLTIATHAIR